MKRAAHFLLLPELLYSPPNNAIIRAYLESGFLVDVFSPGVLEKETSYGNSVRLYPVSYTWMWILRNILSFHWFRYSCFSGTSEDPLALVGLLSLLYCKKSFALVDEIKAGSYRGNRSDNWKNLCRLSISLAGFSIVNDTNRIQLLREYANLNDKNKIIVYPGCYCIPPVPRHSNKIIKHSWGFPDDAFVVASSGGFNMTAGADWLLNSLRDIDDIYTVIQPLGISPLSMFLLDFLDFGNRLFIQKKRLQWEDAWRQASGFDVGLCIYTNPAPQFQKMGVSSNRLCMFIAMGVPVIASKQDSFKFLEEYDCGILVDDYHSFKLAIARIRENHSVMRKNCEACLEEYINPAGSFRILKESINNLFRF